MAARPRRPKKGADVNESDFEKVIKPHRLKELTKVMKQMSVRVKNGTADPVQVEVLCQTVASMIRLVKKQLEMAKLKGRS